MSSSFELRDVDRFTTGTVGPPGQRVFYLQVGHQDGVVSLRLEKAQVAALCNYLGEMMADLPAPAPAPAPEPPPETGTGEAAAPATATAAMDLVEPVVAEWVIASLGVSYDEEDDRFLLVAEELVDLEAEEGADPARATIRVTREQVAAFIRHGNSVVAAGRPPCPLCGGPLDPEGHMCVRLNGHRDLAP